MKYVPHPKEYYCPIVGHVIDDFSCLLTQDACEEMAPVHIAPKEATSKKNWEEICKACKMHDPY